MSPTTPFVIRGRCACGRRYRIRNAQPGVAVQCPNCRRAIPITRADVEAAAADTQLIPLQDENTRPRDAILLDFGELTLAPEGSRPGATGREVFGHEEAALFCAQRGLRASALIDSDVPPGAPRKSTLIRLEVDPTKRAFGHDLAASFYFTGAPLIAVNTLTVGIIAFLLVAIYMSSTGQLRVLVAPVWFILAAGVQFYWSIMRRTAFGEDRAPLWGVEAGLWRDVIKPTFWLLAISAGCFLPAIVVGFFVPANTPGAVPIIWLALALGWLFWPVAILSVALGDSPILLRPDWLVRCLYAIGPAYALIWIVALAGELVCYLLTRRFGADFWNVITICAIRAYTAYVVFRTLGVFFRHRHGRFPWFV